MHTQILFSLIVSLSSVNVMCRLHGFIQAIYDSAEPDKTHNSFSMPPVSSSNIHYESVP